jgi:trehalose 6-phosphate synthase
MTFQVHDYHLIPLRRRCVGSVLTTQSASFHIPFPAWVLAIAGARGVGAGAVCFDLVGFQTENDLQAFRDYVEREAGGWIAPTGRSRLRNQRRAASFPISIDTRVVAAERCKMSTR